MSLERRLNNLEGSAAGGEEVYGIEWFGNPIEVDGEELTREEFEKRYPDGHLLVVSYKEDAEAS